MEDAKDRVRRVAGGLEKAVQLLLGRVRSDVVTARQTRRRFSRQAMPVEGLGPWAAGRGRVRRAAAGPGGDSLRRSPAAGGGLVAFPPAGVGRPSASAAVGGGT